MDDPKSQKYTWSLDLILYEIQRLWTIYGIFLLAETVLVSVVAQLFGDDKFGLACGGAILGLLLLLPWLGTFEYTRYFYLLRLSQAKEMEPDVAAFWTEGNSLAKGLKIRGVRIPRIIRSLRPQHSGWFLVIVFFCAFTLLLVLSIYCIFYKQTQ